MLAELANAGELGRLDEKGHALAPKRMANVVWGDGSRPNTTKYSLLLLDLRKEQVSYIQDIFTRETGPNDFSIRSLDGDTSIWDPYKPVC